MVYILKVGLLFIAYFGTARFGLEMGAVNKFATLFWPPAGISLAVLVLGGRRLWPGIFLGAFFANFATGAPYFAALGIAVGNTLEALLGATLCVGNRRFHTSLHRTRDVGVLIFGAAIGSTFVSPVWGVTSLWVTDVIHLPQLKATFVQWWVGDMISNLVIAPLILVYSSRATFERFRWQKTSPWERFCYILLLVAASDIVLNGSRGVHFLPFTGTGGIYVLIPFLLWGTIRFGQRGAVLITFLVSALAVWNASLGVGPFSWNAGPFNLFQLTSFVFVFSVTGLILGAVLSERESERERLEASTKHLQSLATELRDREAELSRAKDAAELASAAKTAFLANMSHEIRTPLGAILGFSELILTSEMSVTERAMNLEVIKRNGRLLSNIIDDILDLSKVEAGRMDVERIDVSLDEVVIDITSLLYAEAARKGLEMKIFAEGPVPSRIRTDPLRLRQVILNVVGNAIKFTHKGYIHVKIKLSRDFSEREVLTFVVEDTGRGISEEERCKLFSPFSQSDVSTTRKYGGTGLGLILSRRFAQALGGDLVLSQSTPGVGSVFTLWIDPGELKLNSFTYSFLGHPQVAASLEQSKPNALRPFAEIGEPVHVLLVDDSEDNQILMRQILLKAGCERVDIACDGFQAVRMASAANYDIILMDIQMPEMDGMAATRILRQQGYSRPIVALTAHGMIEERRRCLAGGFDEHLCKPVDVKAMIQVVYQMIVRARAAASLRTQNTSEQVLPEA